MIYAMAVHELHTFTLEEVAQLPKEAGVYVLFQVQNPLCADQADDVRAAVTAARSKYPRATHFAVELCNAPGHRSARLNQLRQELRLVRTLAFGSRPD